MAVISPSKAGKRKRATPTKVVVCFMGISSAVLLAFALARVPSSSYSDGTVFEAIGGPTTTQDLIPGAGQQHVPYDESTIVKFSDTLDKAPQTIVTAYFQVKSKHSSSSYQEWIVNMLSLQDPMVIFLSPALIPEIKKLRSHALSRTVIIPMEVGDVPLANAYDQSFWEHQLDIDPEKRIHRSFHVFWIWLSKSWWVNEAIRHNFFQSKVFVWSDMGCFRNTQYNDKEMVQHPEVLPRNALLFLAHHEPNPPPELIWNNKYEKSQKAHHFTSGSLFAGYADTWVQFHGYFLDTIQAFLDRKMFIGEDQTVLQSTCMSHPDICAYLPFTQLKRKDNHYFGLRYALHNGGDYELWWPPPLPEKVS